MEPITRARRRIPAIEGRAPAGSTRKPRRSRDKNSVSRHAKHAVSLANASSFDHFTNIDRMLRMAAREAGYRLDGTKEMHGGGSNSAVRRNSVG